MTGLCLLAVSVGCAASDGGCGRVSAPRPKQAVITSAVPSEVRWEKPIEVARGRAFVSAWNMNESVFDYVDDATVVITERNEVAVGWADNANKDVLFQVYGSHGAAKLPSPTNISRTPQVFSWLPRLVVSGEHVFVLWQEIVFSGGSHGGDIYFARSADAGVSFSDPINLSRSLGGDGKGRLTREIWDNGSLDLVQDAEGTLLAAWTEYSGALWFSRSSDRGTSFTDPIRVGGTEDAPARGPSIAHFKPKQVYLVWASGERSRASLWMASSSDGGQTFESARAFVQSPGRVDAPKIAIGANAVMHLTYTERTHENAPARIRYLRSPNSGRDPEQPRTLSAPDGISSASFPSLAWSASGHVAVTWLHQATIQDPPLGLEFVLSRDGGERFSRPERVPGTGDPALGVTGSRQGRLMRLLSINSAGQVAVASSSFHAGQSSRIRVTRGQVR